MTLSQLHTAKLPSLRQVIPIHTPTKYLGIKVLIASFGFAKSFAYLWLKYLILVFICISLLVNLIFTWLLVITFLLLCIPVHSLYCFLWLVSLHLLKLIYDDLAYIKVCRYVVNIFLGVLFFSPIHEMRLLFANFKKKKGNLKQVLLNVYYIFN